MTVRGRVGLHLDFEESQQTPCGAVSGVAALDEGIGPAFPARPIMERIEGDTSGFPYRYRPLIDLDGVSCNADPTAACCVLAVPIGGMVLARGKLRYSTDAPTHSEFATLVDAEVCVVPEGRR